MTFGEWLGKFISLLGYRKRVVRENLLRAYPGEDTASRTIRRDVESKFYENFGQLIFEIFFLFGPMKRFVSRNATLEGLDHWKAAQNEGKGVLFLSSHLGNWEVMAAAGALASIPLTIVTKQLKPQWLHEAIEAGRLSCGTKATYEPKTLRTILNAIRKKETVGIVLDQYAGHPQGVRVPFLGTPVGTSSGLAVIAKRTEAPVLPVETIRLDRGRFRVIIHPPLKWVKDANPQRELALNTANYASVIEAFVRRTPEQWLWSHRRFKGDLSPLKEEEWSGVRVRAG